MSVTATIALSAGVSKPAFLLNGIPLNSDQTVCMLGGPERPFDEGGDVHQLETTWPAMAELPRLLADAVECDPDGVALTRGSAVVTYSELHREVVALDAAMGVLLGPASLVPIALATVLPELSETHTGELRRVLDELICALADHQSCPQASAS